MPELIVHVDSLDIFPVSWCETNGYPLVYPIKPSGIQQESSLWPLMAPFFHLNVIVWLGSRYTFFFFFSSWKRKKDCCGAAWETVSTYKEGAVDWFDKVKSDFLSNTWLIFHPITAEFHPSHHHLKLSSRKWRASRKQVGGMFQVLMKGFPSVMCLIYWWMFVCPLPGQGNGKYCCPKIYFNHRCFSGPYLNKGRIAELPQFIGPGNCVLVLKEVRRRASSPKT